jgi:hypothetical protein
MAREKKVARLTAGPSPRKKARGRTADVDAEAVPHEEGNSARGRVKLEKMVDVTRPVGKPGTRGGANRGDRRDMSKTYTGSARHASRGNTPRVDVKTRKR